jgi:hypothetical protein
MRTEPTQTDICAHCGAPATDPFPGLLRTAVLVYCSAACCDDHVVAVALDSATCAVTGCDLGPAADVPFCDQHLDPAVGAGEDRGAGWRAA